MIRFISIILKTHLVWNQKGFQMMNEIIRVKNEHTSYWMIQYMIYTYSIYYYLGSPDNE